MSIGKTRIYDSRKILAAIMVFAVALAGVIVVANGDDSYAEESPTTIYVGGEGAADDENELRGSENYPYATLASAIGGATSGNTITLLGDLDENIGAITIDKNLAINFNGFDLSLSGPTIIVKSDDDEDVKLTLYSDNIGSDSKLTYKLTNSGNAAFGNKAVFSIEEKGAVEFSDLTMETNGSAFFPNGQASSVVIENSTITAGVYCVGTNRAESGENKVRISIENSVLTSTGYSEGNVASFNPNDKDDCTVMINIPNATLEIRDSTITGDRQSLLVRTGTATVYNTTINYTGESVYKDNYINTNWASGNEVPMSAVVVGDRTNGSYLGIASLEIDGGEINVKSGRAVYTYGSSHTTASLIIGKTNATSITIDDQKASIKNLKTTTVDGVGLSIEQGSVKISGN